MLNNRKIRLMTKLASYEEKEGREDINLSKYYKSDYVRLQMLKTIVSTTFAYLLVLVMIAIYYSEKLIEQAVTLDYRSIGMRVLGAYIALLTVYVVGTLIGYNIKYTTSRKKLAKYFRMLKRLRLIYREEDEAENMTNTHNQNMESKG